VAAPLVSGTRRRQRANIGAAGLIHEQLAQRLRWPRDTLIHYEHGRRAISVARLAAIAAALDISPAVLLIEDESFSDLVARLAASSELRSQVEFFLSTLAEEET
jgi:transcriptional regulator with XRE-family HTH domain